MAFNDGYNDADSYKDDRKDEKHIAYFSAFDEVGKFQSADDETDCQHEVEKDPQSNAAMIFCDKCDFSAVT